jgi:ribosomal protein S18 acetylase RimI-like enzyme
MGEKLLTEAEKIMSAKVNDVFLLVSDFNQGAQRFYQRCGYRQVGAIPNYVKAGVNELIFHKRLPARES